MAELLELTRPQGDQVIGLLEPIARSWAHEPLGRLLDLIDVMVVVETSTIARPRASSRFPGTSEVWRTTQVSASGASAEQHPPGASFSRPAPEPTDVYRSRRWALDVWLISSDRSDVRAFGRR